MKAIVWRRAAMIALPVLFLLLAKDLSRVLHDHQQVSVREWVFDVAIAAVIGATAFIARLISPPGAYEALLEERAAKDASERG